MLDEQARALAETLRKMRGIHYLSLIPGMTPAEIWLLSAICEESKESKDSKDSKGNKDRKDNKDNKDRKDSKEKRKVSDLCETCGMQPTAVSRLLNSLEKKGLIVREVRKDNRRVTDVEATEEGRKTNEENRREMCAYWEQVLCDVPEGDLDLMLHVLTEIQESMERVLKAKLTEKEISKH